MEEPLIDESCLSDAEIITKAPLALSPTVDSAYASSEDGTESLPSPLVQKREKRLGSSGLTSSSSHQSLAEITDADNDVFPDTNSKSEDTTVLLQPQVVEPEVSVTRKDEEVSLGILHDGAFHTVIIVRNSNTEPDVLSCCEDDEIQPVDQAQDKLSQTVALPMLWNLVPDASVASDALLSSSSDQEPQTSTTATTHHKISSTSSSSTTSATKLNMEVHTKEPKTALLDEGKETNLIVHHSDEAPHSNNCLHSSKQSLIHALGYCRRILHL
ncbi:hypothetical protein RvY_09895 [Ramazzottius varieornatus]|uniref:Uncharacterized protein n=1 Tax=Ramazzottius varieornatus TaxID=947166 RepID=A0A1D1VD27_RAMVA|nr:hypothetical protein RvY_09895 [Ramazzottius varieornatus]